MELTETVTQAKNGQKLIFCRKVKCAAVEAFFCFGCWLLLLLHCLGLRCEAEVDNEAKKLVVDMLLKPPPPFKKLSVYKNIRKKPQLIVLLCTYHHLTDRLDKIICTAVDGVSMTREHNLSCKYIMKEPCLLFPPMFSHTEQTTQPLVMHSFVTSNLLPLGYEAQHRMSEQKRRREGGRESVLYLENDKNSYICG